MDNSFDSLLNASAVPQDEKVQAFIAESRNNRNRCYELQLIIRKWKTFRPVIHI